MPQPLSDAQMRQFHEEGYVVVENLLGDDVLRPVIDEVNAEVNHRAAELIAAGKLSRDYSEQGFERQLTYISQETDALAVSIWNGVLHGPAIFDLIRYPRLLDVAEQICGSDELIASSVYRLRPKIPNHVMGPVPWHQDSGYFEPYCDSAIVLTAWIPLVDATEERGCLWVVPRGHKSHVIPHYHREGKPYLLIREEDLLSTGGARPVCAEVPRGGALLLTNLTPHASFENRSDVVRWAMDLRYQSAALPTNAPISRLPGESTPDEARAVPGACYPPEADFLVRSKRRPLEVVRDAQAFAKLRREHKPGGVNRHWEKIAAEA